MNSYRENTWVDHRVVVRDSAMEGRGGFTAAPIQKDEIVVILGGAVMTQAEFDTYTATAVTYDAVQIDDNLHLVDLSRDPRATNGSLNHSCDSNLWMQDAVTLVARRDIAAGEELTVDYALFTASPQWALDQPCQCGSAACRGTVTGHDWQLPHVQQRYAGHFSPFINRRITALSS